MAAAQITELEMMTYLCDQGEWPMPEEDELGTTIFCAMVKDGKLYDGCDEDFKCVTRTRTRNIEWAYAQDNKTETETEDETEDEDEDEPDWGDMCEAFMDIENYDFICVAQRLCAQVNDFLENGERFDPLTEAMYELACEARKEYIKGILAEADEAKSATPSGDE